MNTKILFVIQIIIVVIISWSCTKDTITDPPAMNNESISSRFSDIQQKVFTTSCAFSGCHGPNNNQADLLLTEGNAYFELVNVQSLLFPQYKRVLPDSSSQSLIIKILRGEVSPQMPLNRTPLPVSVIDSIAKWIDNGAANN